MAFLTFVSLPYTRQSRGGVNLRMTLAKQIILVVEQPVRAKGWRRNPDDWGRSVDAKELALN